VSKKAKGRKRHIADTRSNAMAVGVTSAFVHDKTGARILRDGVEDAAWVKTIVADSLSGRDGL
jgi:hypothetical protein